jgi:hypothetical protein
MRQRSKSGAFIQLFLRLLMNQYNFKECSISIKEWSIPLKELSYFPVWKCRISIQENDVSSWNRTQVF